MLINYIIFFGDKLKLCIKYSDLDDYYKYQEKIRHEAYIKCWQCDNTKFNVKAQFRRYVINRLAHEYAYRHNIVYDYMLVLRFDIIYYYFDVDKFLAVDMYICEDRMLFGKYMNVSYIIDEMGLNFIYLANSDPQLKNELKYCPERILIKLLRNNKINYLKNALDIYTRKSNAPPYGNLKSIYIEDYNLYVFPPDMGKLPEDFEANEYQSLNPDLSGMIDIELKIHYLQFGYFEGRKYKVI